MGADRLRIARRTEGGEEMTVLHFFLQILAHYALQITTTVGLIVVTGLTVAGAKRCFLHVCGRAARGVEICTGFIGTPIHELSHALFCLVFGHKITAICLWSPRGEGGNLGYVSHTYRKRNFWHQLGNFFIGVAPILGGSAVLALLLCLLLPERSDEIFAAAFRGLPENAVDLPFALLLQAVSVLKALFDPQNFLRWDWYLFAVLAILIVLHMEISRSDLSSGLWGFLFLSGLLLALDAVLALVFPAGLSAVTSAMVGAGAFLSAFFCIALCVSALLLLVSLIAALFRRR